MKWYLDCFLLAIIAMVAPEGVLEYTTIISYCGLVVVYNRNTSFRFACRMIFLSTTAMILFVSFGQCLLHIPSIFFVYALSVSNNSIGNIIPSRSIFFTPIVRTVMHSISPGKFSSTSRMYENAPTTSSGCKWWIYATLTISSWRDSWKSRFDADIVNPSTSPAGTYISVLTSYFLTSKWRSWVSRAKDASCCDCAKVIDRASVCRINIPACSGVCELLPMPWRICDFDSKWSRNSCEDSDSAGAITTFDSGTGNSKSSRLSAERQSLPRWLTSIHLKLMICRRVWTVWVTSNSIRVRVRIPTKKYAYRMISIAGISHSFNLVRLLYRIPCKYRPMIHAPSKPNLDLRCVFMAHCPGQKPMNG